MSALNPLRTSSANDDRKATTSTTPLRITKRDSPTSETRPPQRIALPRRNSASWKHVIEGGRVSKSPFKMLSKSSIPLPAKSTTPSSPVFSMLSRKASGEKRPRPPSMSEAAENEYPALRKRRQSQGLQGLTNRKPVSKSPFKSVSVQNQASVSPTGSPTPDDDDEKDLPPIPPPKERFDTGRHSPLPPHRGSPSPVRPSLVSRRLHGPRSSLTKRERRKTVTFDETCDVMEYDVEEDSGSQPFDWVTDEDVDDDGDDDDESDEDRDRRVDAHDTLDDPDTPHHDHAHDTHDPQRGPLRVQNARDDHSDSEGEDAHHVGDDSIAGLVESMLEDTRPQTPPHHDSALPDDLETEDGVPYGRTHHAERLAAAHQRRSESPLGPPPDAFPVTTAGVSTPVHSRPGSPIGSVSPGSRVPLGRSTHAERMVAQKEKEAVEVEEDVQLIPLSPTPVKRQSTAPRSTTESLIPRFSLDATQGARSPSAPLAVGDPSRESSSEGDADEIIEVPTKPEMPASGAVFDMDVEPRSSTESSNGPITPPTSPPRFGMSLGNASKDSFTHVLGTAHANASRESLNRALGITHANASRDSLLGRGGLGMAHGNASRDSLLNRGGFGMSQGNASRDSLVSRNFTTAHANHSRDSLPGRSSTPTELVRSASPTTYHSPFAGSPFHRQLSRSPSPFVRAESPLHRGLPRMGSSTDIHSAGASPSSRGSPRITRENVQKILQQRNSTDSPLREKGDSSFGGPSSAELGPSTDTATNSPAPASQQRPSSAASRIPAPKLTRDNPTFDGVMSLDPEPQPGDPPRPSVATRAASFGVGGDEPGSSGRPASSDDPDDLGFVHLGDMRSALDRLMADVAGEANMEADGQAAVGLKVEAVTEGVRARRHSLPDGPADVSMEGVVTESPVAMSARGQDQAQDQDAAVGSSAMHIDMPSMGPEALLSTSFMSPVESIEPPIRATSPRPPIVKDAIKTREELIKAKKREARRREEEEDEFEEEGSMSGSKDYFTPRRPVPIRRRSLSTSDADDRGRAQAQAMRRRATMLSDGGLLDNVPIEDGEDDPLADSIDRELTRLKGGRTKYHVRQRSEVIHASSEDGHSGSAGDIRAWRMVRRPSDMNEYAQQLKQLQAQQATGKAYAKVFVKVVGIRGVSVPVPQQPTAVSCTLNNGIHFVTTPEFQLGTECRMNQEFELIEQNKLEFTLVFKVRRDPHIITQFKANQPPPPPAPVPRPAPPPASKGGFRSLFREKKPSKPTPPPQPQRPPPHRLQENLARYLKPDGTLARAFVAFKDIARRCDARLFETSFPLIGQRAEETEPPKNLQIGEVVLQVFRLPPLPGIPVELLPGSLEDCHRGMRSTAWHKVTYLEGTLTQNGGDCTSWRRRHFRVIGSNLVAFNNVTKKATATIDLKKAIALEDDKKARDGAQSPISPMSPRSFVEFDTPYGVERSFRILFKNDQEIIFYADTDEEKKQWYVDTIFRSALQLIGLSKAGRIEYNRRTYTR
ncbi:hypothetical protein PsYK624_076550 [Phanerochaete sordida]|uniref:PH domain-containing protein n=1 Tax=Phanerochaete sordida TaxID=48140 RepID=A0A9P3GBC1_9APHY|nr:hypothetical protein PsYK624_076550 [Phanerochaete sordida]